MWRLALLDPSVGNWIVSNPNNPITTLLTTIQQHPVQSVPRPLLLTTLRFLSNAYANESLAKLLVSSGPLCASITAILVPSLLHDDTSVRTAAASLIFNAAALLQKSRVNRNTSVVEDEDWQVEMLSAVLESLDREKTPEVSTCSFPSPLSVNMLY